MLGVLTRDTGDLLPIQPKSDKGINAGSIMLVHARMSLPVAIGDRDDRSEIRQQRQTHKCR